MNELTVSSIGVLNVDGLRLVVFISLFTTLIAFEWLLPKRQWHSHERLATSVSNLLMVTLGSIAIRLLVPISLIALANNNSDFGLFNLVVMPYWLQVLISIILLDCIIYWQHRIFHRIPILWRMHRMHHSDIAMGTTTALRFHPLELVLSYLLKSFFVLILGVDPLSIVLFEILLNGTALWSHSNIRISSLYDRMLRLILVTPDMHRVHHSIYSYEHNSNYGFCLSIWDRLFASYTRDPRDGHQEMLIGLDRFRSRDEQGFWQLLCQPFRKSKSTD